MNNEKQTANLDSVLDRFKQTDFSGIASNEWYLPDTDESAARRTQAEIDFISSDLLREPEIEYPRLDIEVVRETDRIYQELLTELVDMERTPEVDLMLDRIINKLAELYRYEEICLMLGSTGLERLEHQKIASDMSLERTGGIDSDDFAHMVNQLRREAETSDEPYVRELVDMLPEMSVESESVSFELQDKTIEVIRGDLFDLFPGLESLMLEDSDEKISPEESVQHHQDVLDTIGVPWKARLGNGKAARASAKTQEVIIGRDRSDFTPSELNGNRVHEDIGHGYRSDMAKKHENPLCHSPLPGSLDFEEAFATALEQVITGKKRIAGIQYYLSLGLQAGADRDGEGRDSRDTYEIMKRREVLNMTKSGQDVDMDEAERKAQKIVQRTRRGGAIDSRDSAYFMGTKKAYKWLNEIAELPEDERRRHVKWVLSALFDPTDETHVDVVGAVK